MAEDLGEGTEDATPKRRREAREEGNIARSQDASNAILLLGAILVLAATIKPMVLALATMLQNALGGDSMRALRAEGVNAEQIVAQILQAVPQPERPLGERHVPLAPAR